MGKNLAVWPASDHVLSAHLFEGRQADAEFLCYIFLRHVEVLDEVLKRELRTCRRHSRSTRLSRFFNWTILVDFYNVIK